jgi:hypothetical protein
MVRQLAAMPSHVTTRPRSYFDAARAIAAWVGDSSGKIRPELESLRPPAIVRHTSRATRHPERIAEVRHALDHAGLGASSSACA